MHILGTYQVNNQCFQKTIACFPSSLVFVQNPLPKKNENLLSN
jgi:hypothetical protein